MARKTFFVLAAAVLVGCEDPPSEPLGTGLVPDEAFHAQAKAAFESYQSISFSEDIEVCGYFGFDAEGAFIAVGPVRGEIDSCVVDDIPEAIVEIVASYHTHSSFDTEADSEVPSTDDVTTDIEEQVFGYVGTPGGRLWLVDWQEATVTQLCGLYCLSSDEDFIEGDAGPIAHSYTLDDLREREGE
ncbi:MAG: DUF4329 domain-containing protein [Pseudomonadota bacterium]